MVVVFEDGHFLGGDNGTCVHPFVEFHNGDAGDGVAVGDRALNGGRAAIARKKRGMNVEAAVLRCREDVRREDFSVRDDDRDVRLMLREGEMELLSAEFLGLENGNPRLLRPEFDGRRRRMEAATLRPIGLRHDRDYFVR